MKVQKAEVLLAAIRTFPARSATVSAATKRMERRLAKDPRWRKKHGGSKNNSKFEF